MFEQKSCEGLLLVYAKNAFNELNIKAVLVNIHSICPSFAEITTNFYRSPSNLHISGEIMESREGTTQGDPLAMPMFAVAAMPVIRKTQMPNCTQVWIADDATGCGSILALREWWNKAVATGPRYGYYPNAVKAKMLVKASKLQLAESIFADTDIDITADGTRILRSVVGNESFITQYVSEQVSEWCKELRTLLKIAEKEPEASLSCLTRGLQQVHFSSPNNVLYRPSIGTTA